MATFFLPKAPAMSLWRCSRFRRSPRMRNTERKRRKTQIARLRSSMRLKLAASSVSSGAFSDLSSRDRAKLFFRHPAAREGLNRPSPSARRAHFVLILELEPRPKKATIKLGLVFAGMTMSCQTFPTQVTCLLRTLRSSRQRRCTVPADAGRVPPPACPGLGTAHCPTVCLASGTEHQGHRHASPFVYGPAATLRRSHRS